MDPATDDFQRWWHHWRLLSSGNGSLADVAMASYYWTLALNTQKKLGKVP